MCTSLRLLATNLGDAEQYVQAHRQADGQADLLPRLPSPHFGGRLHNGAQHVSDCIANNAAHHSGPDRVAMYCRSDGCSHCHHPSNRANRCALRYAHRCALTPFARAPPPVAQLPPVVVSINSVPIGQQPPTSSGTGNAPPVTFDKFAVKAATGDFAGTALTGSKASPCHNAVVIGSKQPHAIR